MSTPLERRQHEKAARFRAEADKAIALAERAHTPEIRRQLLVIARVYLALADRLAPAPTGDN
jgi:hypothetical protein